MNFDGWWEEKYYVYTLEYPESMGGYVFYIGKGSISNKGIDRIDEHEQQAKKGVNSPRCDSIREILQSGEHVVKRKIYEDVNELDALMYETALVALMSGYGHLTNVHRASIPRTVFWRYVHQEQGDTAAWESGGYLSISYPSKYIVKRSWKVKTTGTILTSYGR